DRFVRFSNVTDEAIAFARECANHALPLAAIAHRLTGHAHAAAERRLRNDAAVPNHSDQFIIADNPFAIANEMHQNIENLGLDFDRFRTAPALAPVDVESVLVEEIDHYLLPILCPERKIQGNHREKSSSAQGLPPSRTVGMASKRCQTW